MRNRLIVLLFFGLAALGAAQPAPEAEDAALRHARQLLKTTPLIDGHNDLPREIYEYPQAPGDIEAYDLRTRRPGDRKSVV